MQGLVMAARGMNRPVCVSVQAGYAAFGRGARRLASS